MAEHGFSEGGNGQYQVKGLMTFATVPDLLGHSETWLAKNDGGITIDLGQVDKADSAGLALMVEWKHLASVAQRPLKFVNIPDQLTQLIRISGLQKLFES